MTGFAVDWLALREPFDAAARAAPLVDALRDRLAAGRDDAPLAVVDLGAGTGSNLRYLAPRLGGRQRWLLVDDDAALLEAAIPATQGWARSLGAATERRPDGLAVHGADFDLTLRCALRDLGRAGPRAGLADVPIEPSSLVTASALLDLVSAAWLDALVERARAAAASVCFALSYDGRATAVPPERDDAEVLALFNDHQTRDKGLGPALGPRAAPTAAARLEAAGYGIATAASDWHIAPHARAMQHALLDGWLTAASEMAPTRVAALRAWHARRAAHVAAGRSALTVGHVDVVGWPGAGPSGA